MTQKLAELAKLIRSKNAGPFQLTIDVMFDDPETYRRVRDSGAISPAAIRRIYRVAEEKIGLFVVDKCLAIKVSIPRPVFQGEIHDSDSHAGQQYPPLMDLEIPTPA